MFFLYSFRGNFQFSKHRAAELSGDSVGSSLISRRAVWKRLELDFDPSYHCYAVQRSALRYSPNASPNPSLVTLLCCLQMK